MGNVRVITLVIAAALFMENLDGTVIATSLPAIAEDLRIDPIILKLAFTAYFLSLAIFIPVSGWCADRFGARSVFQVAVAVFTLASIGCAMSSDLAGLVAARFGQGIGGAMMVPVGRLIILRVVEKRDMVSAMAWLTVPALIAPLLGPPLGGFITTYWHWRWIFWLNVPIGILGIVLAAFLIPQVKEEERRPLDLVGFILSGLGLSALIFGLSVIGRDNIVPVAAQASLVVGGLALVGLYLVHARRTPHPLVDLGLLRIPTFRIALTAGTLYRIGIGAIPFLLPLMLQEGFGLSPFASGSLTFAAAGGALLMKLTAAPILRRFGFRRVLLVNTVISTASLGVIALFTAETPHLVILVVLLAGGFFRSLQFTSLNALSYADVEPRLMSRATSLAAVTQQIALSVGVAFAALVLEVSQLARGAEDLIAADFAAGFLAVAALSMASVVIFARLRHDAGAEVSGHAIATAPAQPDGRGTRG